MVAPSCPALVIHDDDAFRKSLIATLDQKHFTVTVASTDARESIEAIRSRPFQVIILSVDLANGKGTEALEYLQHHAEALEAALIVIGESDPELRMRATAADETLLKPVDPAYVAERALTYCQ